VAAGVFLALAVGLLLWMSPRERSPIMASADGAAVSGTYLLASTRAGTQGTVIDVQAGSGLVRLRIIPESDARTPFRVALSSGSTTAANFISVTAANGVVDVYLDPDTLGSGTYELRVVPQAGAAGAAEEVHPFTLNVQPKL
jgi:hypothetical protein